MEFVLYNKKPSIMRVLVGTPERIRTSNLLIRSEVLYPVEPRVHIKFVLLQAWKFTLHLNSIQNKKGS